MNKKPYWLMVMLILVLVFMAGRISNNVFPVQSAQAQKTQEREAPELRRWEYLSVGGDGYSEFVEKANRLGEQGWELVTAVRLPTEDFYRGYFKRPKP